MTLLLGTFLPLIALIGLGALFRHLDLLGETSARELTRYVVWLALPCLLFEATSGSPWHALWQPGFLATFTGGIVGTFVIAVALSAITSRGEEAPGSHVADRVIDGLGATYANTGFIGIPLTTLLFGREALLPATIATLMTACVLFAVAIVLVEFGTHRGSRAGTAWKAARATLGNPLVLASAIGALWAAGGWAMPEAPHRIIRLLADSASPCALVSIGALLVAKAPPGTSGRIAPIVLAKLIAQPAVCALLVYRVFPLDPLWADTAVVLSALPTGTGPYMLAELYDRNAARASRVVLITTVLSLVTVSAVILLVRS